MASSILSCSRILCPMPAHLESAPPINPSRAAARSRPLSPLCHQRDSDACSDGTDGKEAGNLESCKEIMARSQKDAASSEMRMSRRETVLRSCNAAFLAAIFHFSGTRPGYLGVQKNPPSLALCPRTPNCISTSEEFNDPSHFVPPWTYNPEDGRGRKNPVSKEHAMKELLEVIKSTKPDNFTPRIIKQNDDYVYVEYESPILGFIDDVEFWFPPGNHSLVEYRSAARLGQFDFDINRKRIKALRQALEKKGWQSVGF